MYIYGNGYDNAIELQPCVLYFALFFFYLMDLIFNLDSRAGGGFSKIYDFVNE